MMQSILEQPEAIRRVLVSGLKAEQFVTAFRARDIRKVWLVGSGTSLFAAMIAAHSWETELEIDCEAVSSLEFLDQTQSGRLNPDVMVLAISQSGASLILLECVRRANAAGALTAIVTANPAAPIPLEAGFTIETHTGNEENLGKSKGFTTTALGAVLLGRRLAMGDTKAADATLQARYEVVPAAFARAIEASRAAAGKWAQTFRDADALYVVGAGVHVPTALEGALKVLEVAKMPVITKELEEMMHGPFNGVGPKSGIVLIADDTARQDRLAAFIKGVSLIGTASLKIAGSPTLADSASYDLALPACSDEAVRAILGVVPFQLFAHDLAAARGAAIDTARYPQLYPVFVSKSIHK
jgi:fructoselysine-6-P-deglycase FrlB-like protein